MNNNTLVISFVGAEIKFHQTKNFDPLSKLITLDGLIYFMDGNQFNGFHDWIIQPIDNQPNGVIVGVELYPFCEDVKKFLSNVKGGDASKSGFSFFAKESSSWFSNGDQCFLIHCYGFSKGGEMIAVLSNDGNLNFDDSIWMPTDMIME